MKKTTMEEKILKWMSSKNEHIETKVLGLDGDFGVGKTTYINEFFDWKEIENKSIKKSIHYVNLLNLELNDNFINNLIKIFTRSKDLFSSIKEKGIVVIKKLMNTLKNELKLTSDSFMDQKLFEEKTLKYEKNKEKFFNNSVLILDDIERINPENILKVLGLINQLSYRYKEMKILVPFNSKVLKDILNNFFGIQNSENKQNYLQKYLGNSINFEVDYPELADFIQKDFHYSIKGTQIESFLNYLKKLNINWRDIILLKEYIKNFSNWESFIEKNGLILFNKETFKNNMITYKNNKYILLKEEENYFKKQLLDNNHESKIRIFQLIKKFAIEKPWPSDIKKPNNFKEGSEVKNIFELNEEIYNYFKKHHNI